MYNVLTVEIEITDITTVQIADVKIVNVLNTFCLN